MVVCSAGLCTCRTELWDRSGTILRGANFVEVAFWRTVCDENVCVRRNLAIPNILVARVLECPITMAWRQRAAVNFYTSAVAAGYGCRLGVQVDYAAPVKGCALCWIAMLVLVK